MRIGRGLGPLLVMALIGAGIALRIIGLNESPRLDGDEAWHAVQVTRWWRGEPYALWTGTGLPLSPLHVALELPLLVLFGPTTWWLRIPPLVTGLAAIGLLLWFGPRLLDRRTALIAATMLAVLPAGIASSRISYESAHAPLYGIIALLLADRLRLGWLAALVPMAYFVHPTNLLVAPVLMVPIVRRTLEESWPDRHRMVRLMIARVGLIGAVVLATGIATLLRPSTRLMSQVYDAGLHGPHVPGLYLQRLLAILLSHWDGTRDRHAVWIVLLVALVLLLVGLPRLARSRRWDRLGLIAATWLCIVAQFLMGGSNIVLHGMDRYSYFLIVPVVLSLACLVDACLIAATAPRAGALRCHFRTVLAAGQRLGLAGCGALLLYVGAPLRDEPARALCSLPGIPPAPEPRHPGDLQPLPTIVQLIRNEAQARVAQRRDGIDSPVTRLPMPVVTESMDGLLLELMMIQDPLLASAHMLKLGADLSHQAIRVRQIVRRGGLVVAEPGGQIESALLDSLPRLALRHRELIGPGFRRLVIYDLPEPGTEQLFALAADLDGDGRADPTVVDLDTAAWTTRYSTTGSTEQAFPFESPGEPLVADFDGDGRIDRAQFQHDAGLWSIRLAHGGRLDLSTIAIRSRPVPADYDGDGRADCVNYLAPTSHWFFPGRDAVNFGWGRHFGGRPWPVPADYDGDGRADLAIYEPSVATWFVLGTREGPRGVHCGSAQAVPVPADYDGDRRTDLAVFEPSTATWTIERSRLGSWTLTLGPPGAWPVPADYDGDGQADPATFDPRTGRWQIQSSATEQLVHHEPLTIPNQTPDIAGTGPNTHRTVRSDRPGGSPVQR